MNNTVTPGNDPYEPNNSSLTSTPIRQIDEGLQERISMLVVAVRTSTRRDAEPEKQDATAQPDKERPTGPPQLTELKLTPEQSALFGESTGYFYVIWMRGKEPLFHSANEPAELPVPQSRDAAERMRDTFRESLLFAAPVDCVLVGRSIAAEQAELRTLAAVLAATGGVVLAAGLIGGWWLATRMIRPVQDISATAAKIAAGALNHGHGNGHFHTARKRRASSSATTGRCNSSASRRV